VLHWVTANVGALTVGGGFDAESARPGMPTTGCDTEIKENFDAGLSTQ